MEFVTLGKASSDKIHVKYNDKIATFHGEMEQIIFWCLLIKQSGIQIKKQQLMKKQN